MITKFILIERRYKYASEKDLEIRSITWEEMTYMIEKVNKLKDLLINNSHESYSSQLFKLKEIIEQI
jgi:hypothetical protein